VSISFFLGSIATAHPDPLSYTLLLSFALCGDKCPYFLTNILSIQGTGISCLVTGMSAYRSDYARVLFIVYSLKRRFYFTVTLLSRESRFSLFPGQFCADPEYSVAPFFRV
jgi:hypothetical protein